MWREIEERTLHVPCLASFALCSVNMRLWHVSTLHYVGRRLYG